MEKLLEKTIPGAGFDPFARDPPPRCLPGTRLAILERCLHFIRTCNGKRKTRWFVGAAGVGKSAVMQSVVESPELAVSSHNHRLSSAGRVLVVIDDLDECHNPRTRLEFLRLISDLCIKYASSPLVWLIASRPEQHITSFFSQSDVASAYEKEKTMVDSDKAHADVERYLRDKLKKIKEGSDSVDPRSPEGRDFWKLAKAAGGLFAYADTAVRYIGDATIGSPASQLSDVLDVINSHSMTDLPQEDHPMALLDALYARILFSVPSKVMMNTRKFLLALTFDIYDMRLDNFILLCNWLCMTPDEAYAAISIKHLHSVLRVPRLDKAHEESLELFHKSFMDYIFDFRRSGFSHGFEHEARQLKAQCIFRVLNEAPDGIDFNNAYDIFVYGILRQGPSTGAKISVPWPVEEDVGTTDNVMRLRMYKQAITEIATGMKRGDPTFQSEFCIHILSTRFEYYHNNFPFASLCDSVFDRSRRQEFVTHGILKPLPLKAIDVSTIFVASKLQFRRPATATKLSDSWMSSCTHTREGEWGEGIDQNWATSFVPHECVSCKERLVRQLGVSTIRSPDQALQALFSSTDDCCVEFRFVDPDDGISEWTYWFWYRRCTLPFCTICNNLN